jgi:predicted RNA-binding protein
MNSYPTEPALIDHDAIEIMIAETKDQPDEGKGNNKLHFYVQNNPLLDIPIEAMDSNVIPKSSLKIGGTINYPESFNDQRIAYRNLLPSELAESFNALSDFQLITGDSEPLSEHVSVIFLMNSMKLLGNPKKIIKRILSLKHRNEPGKLLYVPGVATANNLAILVYLGVDIIDSVQCILQARAGNLMTSYGLVSKSVTQSIHGLCSCSGCKELQSNNRTFESILKHNQNAIYSELQLVKSSLVMGTLRELVEQRMATEPALSSIIRELDLNYYDDLEQYFPVYHPHRVSTCSRDSLMRVDIVRFRNRIAKLYQKPDDAKVLILLPCSSKKPYSSSKSHKLFRDAINVNRGSNELHHNMTYLLSVIGLKTNWK